MISDKDIAKNKEEINNLLKSTDRKGIDNVIDYLESNDFYNIPASVNHSYNWKGGLAEHSLNVYRKALVDSPHLPKDSLIIVGLLHAISNAGRLRYNEKGELHHREVHIHGHGSRSVKILDILHLSLTDEERLAIRWHMHSRQEHHGDDAELVKARKSKLWSALHIAFVSDMSEE